MPYLTLRLRQRIHAPQSSLKLMINRFQSSSLAWGRPAIVSIVIPIVLGAFLAGTVAILVENFEPVWTILVLAGGVVLVGSLIVKDSSVYWLSLFFIALPLNISKNFVTPAILSSQLQEMGFPPGAFTLYLQLTDLPLMVLLGSWIARAIIKREALYWPAISYFPLAYLAWATLGLLFSSYPSLTIFELIRQCKFFIIYLFIINNVNTRKLGQIIILLLLAGAFIQEGVTLGKYQFQLEGTVLGDTFGDESDRLVPTGTVTGEESESRRGEGTFGHSNATAAHLELVLPFALVLFLTSPRPKERWLGLFVFLLGVVTVYVTFSRGGMVGLLVAASVCMAVAFARGLVSRTTIAAILSVGVLLSPIAINKLSSYFAVREEAFNQRVIHWKVGIEMIQLNPVIGTGLNTSTVVRRQLIRANELIDDEYQLHNHYLIGLVETGVIGSVMYLCFFILVGLEAFRRSRSKDFRVAMISMAILSAYTAIALHMTIDFLNLDPLHTLLWIYAGVIVAFRRSDPDPGHKVIAAAPLAV